MTYAVSDLHGRFDLYRLLLERLHFSGNDTLYILGDLVDRGEQGLAIILDVMDRPNVHVLMGNHDYLASAILGKLSLGFRPGERADWQEMIDRWLLDGGRATYREFQALLPLERRLVLNAMGDFLHFAEVRVGERDFVLSHGGIGNFEPTRPLSEYSIHELAFTRTDYAREYFKDKYFITGHTPTALIEGATEGRIYKCGNNIAIDCGAVFDLGLGCLCLDTMQEIYVK